MVQHVPPLPEKSVGLAASSYNERVRAQYAQHAQAHAQYGAAYAYQSVQQYTVAPQHDGPRY